jgi:hypothetical protein
MRLQDVFFSLGYHHEGEKKTVIVVLTACNLPNKKMKRYSFLMEQLFLYGFFLFYCYKRTSIRNQSSISDKILLLEKHARFGFIDFWGYAL